MTKTPDLTGKTFGYLTAISLERENGHPSWRCRCVCGKERMAMTGHLTRLAVKSCGCKNWTELNHGNRKYDATTSLLRAKVSNYKAGAKFRGMEWSLEPQEACDLLSSRCHYCGIEPNAIYKHPSMPASGTILINGIDRIDSRRGYVKGNVVSCCKTCNFAKNDMTTEQFNKWLDRIANWRS